MTDQYDIAVIGGGPGGYVAAIKAAQLGMKTVCIEKRATLGGTCLNVGCIPSKALLKSSELYAIAEKKFSDHGITAEGLSFDLGKMMGRKDKVVEDLTTGIGFLFKKYGVDHVNGFGSFKSATEIAVDGGETISAKNIIIATGSEVSSLPGIEIDEARVVSSTGALSLPEVPKHLVVIGGGVIGLELGSVYKRLGAEVTVVEYLDRILPGMDGEVSKTFQRILKKQGISFKTKTKVTGLDVREDGVTVSTEAAAGGKEAQLGADYVLVAVGRRAFTEGLNLEAAGLKAGERGMIDVDDHLRTSVPNIWAIGDVIKGPMLAHKAEEEGVAVVERIAGQKPHINYNAIPGIVYTAPEVAAVGQTTEELKEAGVEVKSASFPMTANSRARSTGETDGFVKLIADAKTDRLLGAHIIGADAGTLIHELVQVIEYGGSSEDIARTSHGHPTFAEAVKEAALAIQAKPIHM